MGDKKHDQPSQKLIADPPKPAPNEDSDDPQALQKCEMEIETEAV